MTREEALDTLSSDVSDDRLRAARILAREAESDDATAIQKAYASETNRYVRGALYRAILRIRGGSPGEESDDFSTSAGERASVEIHNEAVQETTQRLIHEIRPIVGRLGVYIEQEVPDHRNSKTHREWAQLQGLLKAIVSLGDAATSPILEEFDLSQLLRTICESEAADSGAKLEFNGPSPLIILGATSQLQLIMRNAVRNAIEANSENLGTPIVITWGETDRDYWIAVLDEGSGLPITTDRLFDISVTTKKDHFGMGLAVARQAALAFDGKLSLKPRHPKGARFELRWPKMTQ